MSIAASCTECRSRKKRCDGTETRMCSRCVGLGQPCVFPLRKEKAQAQFKACQECRIRKRKCDRVVGVCGQCRIKGSACVYSRKSTADLLAELNHPIPVSPVQQLKISTTSTQDNHDPISIFHTHQSSNAYTAPYASESATSIPHTSTFTSPIPDAPGGILVNPSSKQTFPDPSVFGLHTPSSFESGINFHQPTTLAASMTTSSSLTSSMGNFAGTAVSGDQVSETQSETSLQSTAEVIDWLLTPIDTISYFPGGTAAGEMRNDGGVGGVYLHSRMGGPC